jgi:hypothetical protein
MVRAKMAGTSRAANLRGFQRTAQLRSIGYRVRAGAAGTGVSDRQTRRLLLSRSERGADRAGTGPTAQLACAVGFPRVSLDCARRDKGLRNRWFARSVQNVATGGAFRRQRGLHPFGNLWSWQYWGSPAIYGA